MTSLKLKPPFRLSANLNVVAEPTSTENRIDSLEVKIAQLELEATRSASLLEPDTAHCMRKSYDEICEEIISLKQRLNK